MPNPVLTGNEAGPGPSLARFHFVYMVVVDYTTVLGKRYSWCNESINCENVSVMESVCLCLDCSNYVVVLPL